MRKEKRYIGVIMNDFDENEIKDIHELKTKLYAYKQWENVEKVTFEVDKYFTGYGICIFTDKRIIETMKFDKPRPYEPGDIINIHREYVLEG